MTESRRRRVNRQNAQASTGPRSAGGKRRVSRNARTHGLTVSVLLDPDLAPRVEELARVIAGAEPSPQILEGARRIAEAHIDVLRVREVGRALLDDETARVRLPSVRAMRRALSIIKMMKNEKLAMMRMEELIAGENGVQLTLEEGVGFLAKRLAQIERYERRALSRRKRVMREFDRLAMDRSKVGPA